MNLSWLNVGQQRHKHNTSVRLLPRPSYSMDFGDVAKLACSRLSDSGENTKEKGARNVGGEREKGKRKARLSRSLEQAIAEPANGGETNLLGPRDPRHRPRGITRQTFLV